MKDQWKIGHYYHSVVRRETYTRTLRDGLLPLVVPHIGPTVDRIKAMHLVHYGSMPLS